MADTKKGAVAPAKKNSKKTTKKTAPKKAPAKNIPATRARRSVGDVSHLHGPIMEVLDRVGPKGSLPGQIAKAVAGDQNAVKKALEQLAEQKRVLKPLKRGAGAFWTAAPKPSAAA